MERIPIGQTLSMMKNPFLVKMAGTLDSINSIVVQIQNRLKVISNGLREANSTMRGFNINDVQVEVNNLSVSVRNMMEGQSSTARDLVETIRLIERIDERLCGIEQTVSMYEGRMNTLNSQIVAVAPTLGVTGLQAYAPAVKQNNYQSQSWSEWEQSRDTEVPQTPLTTPTEPAPRNNKLFAYLAAGNISINNIYRKDNLVDVKWAYNRIDDGYMFNQYQMYMLLRGQYGADKDNIKFAFPYNDYGEVYPQQESEHSGLRMWLQHSSDSFGMFSESPEGTNQLKPSGTNALRQVNMCDFLYDDPADQSTLRMADDGLFVFTFSGNTSNFARMYDNNAISVTNDVTSNAIPNLFRRFNRCKRVFAIIECQIEFNHNFTDILQVPTLIWHTRDSVIRNHKNNIANGYLANNIGPGIISNIVDILRASGRNDYKTMTYSQLCTLVRNRLPKNTKFESICVNGFNESKGVFT